MVLVDQEIIDLLSRIDQVLARLEGATFKEKIESASLSFRDLERIMLRVLVVMRRFTGDENVDRILEKLSRIVIMLRMVQMAAHFATAAMGPWGVLLAAASGLSVAVMGAETLGSMVDTR